jgi:hypothetical protein
MKKTLWGAAVVLAVLFAAAGGYYAGTHQVSGLSRITREVGKTDNAPPPKGGGSSTAPAGTRVTRLATR